MGNDENMGANETSENGLLKAEGSRFWGKTAGNRLGPLRKDRPARPADRPQADMGTNGTKLDAKYLDSKGLYQVGHLIQGKADRFSRARARGFGLKKGHRPPRRPPACNVLSTKKSVPIFGIYFLNFWSF